MDKNSDFNGGFALTLTLLAAITGSYFFLNSPLVSLRPDQGSVIYDPTSESQFVRARLWQDPLLAAYDDWNNRTKAGVPSTPNDPLPHHIFDLPDNLIPQENENTLRLLVMQGEETYVENIEQRRRQRYALISALTGKDYVPEDEAHLGYLLAPQFDPDETSTSTMLIAYETFQYFAEPFSGAEKNYKGPKKVHVLWLNATDFDEHTLMRLSGLLTYMDHCDGAKCQRNTGAVTNVVLGPNSTGELTAMYEQELESNKGLASPLEEQNGKALRYVDEIREKALAFQPPPVLGTEAVPTFMDSKSYAKAIDLPHFRFYEPSPRSEVQLDDIKKTRAGLIFIPSNVTGPLDVVLKDDTLAIDEQATTERVEALIATRLGIKTYQSSILRDDLILRELLKELRNRGICNDPAQIYIISEQDTLYGRILDDLLLAQERGIGCKAKVVEIGYLRGIDGEMPLSDANKTAEASTQTERKQGQDDQGQTVAELFAPPGKERMAGPAQLDYISSLADKIMIEVQKVEGPIAIGVLGSDVYDKLLILQSLKSRLPSAVFFTTDLDSRLSGPEVYKWTRNLLIASSHKLEYDDPVAKNAANITDNGATDFFPVFRDAYQTSFFQATRMALDFATNDDNASVPYIRPRLFEIGRTGPLELTPLPEDSGNAGIYPDDQLEGKAREDQRVLFNKLQVPVRFVLCVPLLIFLAWALVMRCFKANDKRIKFLEGGSKNLFSLHAFDQVIVLSATAIFFKVLFLLIVTIRGSEPLYLFEGVSVYPVLSLQLSTIVMAVAMITITRGHLLQAKGEVEQRFRIQTKVVNLNLSEKVDGHGPLSIHELWSSYTWMPRIRKILQSILINTIIATIIVLFLLHISGTGALFTGKLQFSIGNQDLADNTLVSVVRGLSLFSVLLMYFICIKVYQHACRLMTKLSRNEIYGWSDTSRPPGIANQKQAMDLIVEITKIITPIIYYPFFLFTMLLLSRNSLFEGWVLNWPLVLLFAGFIVYIFFQAANFQMRASSARNRILERLKKQKINRLGNSYKHPGNIVVLSTSNSTPASLAASDKEYDGLLDYTIEEIKGMNSGAFVHWTSHPLFKAVALPSSSLGILAVLLQ